jgi:hypothetical protein
MLSEQLMFVHLAFLQKMETCHGEEFEGFFHDLMSYRYADYTAVRTHGDIGDMGADGLRLDARELYACYSPQTIDGSAIRSKFRKDLKSAIRQRNGQFGTFVFVFNDKRGTHPEIAQLLAEAKATHPDLSFRSMTCRSLWREVMQLEKAESEILLGMVIPVEGVVYGIGMADLQPLLDHLAERRRPADPDSPIELPNLRKMQYNNLSPEYCDLLKRGMRDSGLVEEYYQKINDPLMHDEVASGFAEYYRQARYETADDPDEIMWEMQRYVMGNMLPKPQAHIAAWAVLTHFFERCHIFESPPDDWIPGPAEGSRT